jgi:hypothetical protein
VTAVADSTSSLDDLPLPRRLAVTELAGEILAGEGEMAHLYAAFARDPAPQPLRAGLEELARAKQAQVALAGEVLASVGDVGAPLPSRFRAPTARAGAQTRRAERFLEAFQGERALEVRYRELAALLASTGLLPGLGTLAAQAARHQTHLRELYLKYS